MLLLSMVVCVVAIEIVVRAVEACLRRVCNVTNLLQHVIWISLMGVNQQLHKSAQKSQTRSNITNQGIKLKLKSIPNSNITGTDVNFFCYFPQFHCIQDETRTDCKSGPTPIHHFSTLRSPCHVTKIPIIKLIRSSSHVKKTTFSWLFIHWK